MPSHVTLKNILISRIDICDSKLFKKSTVCFGIELVLLLEDSPPYFCGDRYACSLGMGLMILFIVFFFFGRDLLGGSGIIASSSILIW